MLQTIGGNCEILRLRNRAPGTDNNRHATARQLLQLPSLGAPSLGRESPVSPRAPTDPNFGAPGWSRLLLTMVATCLVGCVPGEETRGRETDIARS